MPEGKGTSGNSVATEWTQRQIRDAVLALVSCSTGGIVFSGNVANYAGAEIELTGLTANGSYELVSVTYRLTGGTAGNVTQPSVGKATAFTQGDMDDRHKVSAVIPISTTRTVETLPSAVPIVADASGKLYLKGAAPANADSLFEYQIDLRSV